MKLATIVTLLVLAHRAIACPPLPTCAVDYCHAAEAVVEATVIDVERSTESPVVRLEVTTAFGDVAAGEVTASADPGVIEERDIGSVVVLALQRASAGLVIDQRIAFGPAFDTECFPADSSLADVAGTVLASNCAVELDVQRDGPPCDEGGCAAGSGAGGLVGFGAAGVILRRRAKRRTSR